MSHRTFATLVCLALTAFNLAAFGLVLVFAVGADPADAARAAVVGGAAIVVVGAALWWWLDRRVYAPMEMLAGEARTLAQSRQRRTPVMPPHHRLGDLPAAVAELNKALNAGRGDLEGRLAAATGRLEEQKRWLEVILLDMSEGVLVCGPGHELLLYNQAAHRLFGTSESIGLGRSLFSLVSRSSILHALDILDHRARHIEARNPADLSAMFVCATADRRTLLQGRMALIRDAAGQMTAYVLTLTEVSTWLAALDRQDMVRRALNLDLRHPIANLMAAAETVTAYPDMPAEERHSFEQVILKESAELSQRLDALAAEYRAQPLGRWPMADIHSIDLFSCIGRAVSAESGIILTSIGIPLWLHGDSHLLLLAFSHLLRRVHEQTGISEFDAEALLGDRRVYVDITWPGQPVPAQRLNQWLDEAVEGSHAHRTVRDILERHGSEPWCQARSAELAVLRVPLLAPTLPQFKEPSPDLPSRPEFYDFDLLHRHSEAGDLADRPLRALTFVVFDTETTGLHPEEGDEVVALAGVRVVNGRVLTGETFDRLINPRRPIPEASTRFHGITDAMVADKPPIEVVLPQFKAFVDDAVLVAHNAAFDLKFLELKEAASGVQFANPVLDTMVLSALVEGHLDNHSLEAVAERFGVPILDRHAALGDALATAAILVRQIELLEARGLRSFGQTIREADEVAAKRFNTVEV